MPTVDYAAKVERTMERIAASDSIHPANKSAIQDFKRDLKLDGLSDAWLSKLLGHLFILAEHLGDTRFEEMETDDVKDLVEWAQDRKKENGESVSDATVRADKQAIKRFWRWQHDLPRGEHPPMTDWINTGSGNGGNGTLPKDLLTRDDIDALKAACRNKRDLAFIALLYETGARIGELIDLTVGDIEDHAHGKKVVIDGKTGQRRLSLLESTPSINKWLNDHPNPTNDAPLWCQLQDGDEKLSYHYIRQKLLERARDRAGIEKPVNPHHFRHSRATYLANKFKEAQLCEWFGWVQGSSVPGKYVHLSGRDIVDAYSELHGLRSKEDEDEDKPVMECYRCTELNEADARFCVRCGQALDVEAAEEVEVVQEQAEDLVVDVESPTEARVVRAVLKDLREKPAEYMES